METSTQKRLGKIGILSKENAPDWFCQMKSHLRGKRLWKIIQNVIKKQNAAPAASANTESFKSSESCDQPTPETIPESLESINKLQNLANDEE